MVAVLLFACLVSITTAYEEVTPSYQIIAVGTTAKFINPCATYRGVFSKRAIYGNSLGVGDIWANGTLVKTGGKFSFANETVSIHDVTPDEDGLYVWMCYEYDSWRVRPYKLVTRYRLPTTAFISGEVGYDVELYRPCSNESGRFSKDNETLWRDGVVADGKEDKFYYYTRDGVLYLKSYEPTDAGEYIWTCEYPYSKSKIVVTTLKILRQTLSRENGTQSDEQALTRGNDFWWLVLLCVSAPLCGLGLIVIVGLVVSIRRLSRNETPDVATKTESVELCMEELPPTYQDVVSAIDDYSDPPAYHVVVASRK